MTCVLYIHTKSHQVSASCLEGRGVQCCPPPTNIGSKTYRNYKYNDGKMSGGLEKYLHCTPCVNYVQYIDWEGSISSILPRHIISNSEGHEEHLLCSSIILDTLDMMYVPFLGSQNVDISISLTQLNLSVGCGG